MSDCAHDRLWYLMRKDYQQYRVTATPAQTMRFYPDNRRVNSINFNLGTQKQASSRVHRLALAKPRVLVLARPMPKRAPRGHSFQAVVRDSPCCGKLVGLEPVGVPGGGGSR